MKVDDGIVVDELCRASAEGIFAAGDVANHFHPVFGRNIRTEHWQNAIRHGEAAARNMLDRAQPYREIPWFWSDQYEHNMQYTGFHTEWDEVVIRGKPEDRDFVAFFVKGGKVQAVFAMNQGSVMGDAAALIGTGAAVDASTLADEAVALQSLVPSP